MKIALVTGAGRGLGLSFTRHLIQRGHRVFATVRDKDRAKGLLDLKSTASGRLHIESLDVSDDESVRALRESVGKLTSHLDLLVNNAGINARGVPAGQGNVKMGSLEAAGIERMIRVNAIGPLLLTQAFLDLLEAADGAKVMSVSSWLGSISGKKSGGNYAYCTSKTTLNMLTRTMAFDLAPKGITSVVVNPGWVSTDMGGPKATLSAEDSAHALLDVVERATIDDAGKFLQWDGSEHPW